MNLDAQSIVETVSTIIFLSIGGLSSLRSITKRQDWTINRLEDTRKRMKRIERHVGIEPEPTLTEIDSEPPPSEIAF